MLTESRPLLNASHLEADKCITLQALASRPVRNVTRRGIMAVTQAKNKYHLRSLHEEIGLYDRKIAHLLRYDRFESHKERDAAAAKLSSKREVLVRAARQLIGEGVEYKVSELPHSLCTPEQLVRQEPVSLPEKSAPVNSSVRHSQTVDVLDFRKEVQAYLENRRRTQRQPISVLTNS